MWGRSTEESSQNSLTSEPRTYEPQNFEYRPGVNGVAKDRRGEPGQCFFVNSSIVFFAQSGQ
jgi:hypothetical protein